MRFRGPGRRSSPRTGLALALVLVTGLTLLFTQAPPLHLRSEGWGDTMQEKSVTAEGAHSTILLHHFMQCRDDRAED